MLPKIIFIVKIREQKYNIIFLAIDKVTNHPKKFNKTIFRKEKIDKNSNITQKRNRSKFLNKNHLLHKLYIFN